MTRFEDVYKIFLSSIQDYNIKKMFDEDFEIAEDLLQTFLIRAVSHFKNCVKPIKQKMNLDIKCFEVNLDIDEINIISDLMVLSWLDWNNNNIIQMNISLNDNDCLTVLIY